MYVPNLDKETQRGATHTLAPEGGATLKPNLDKETRRGATHTLPPNDLRS